MINFRAISGIVTTLWIIRIVLPAPAARAADAEQLMTVYNQILTCRVDPASTVDVRDFVMTSHGTRISLDSGRIVFFAPVVVDSTPLSWGAYFDGRGRFEFTAPAEMERHQLRTHFDRTQLDGTIDNILLFYSDGLLDSLQQQGERSSDPLTQPEVDGACGRLRFSEKSEPHAFPFALLQNLTNTSPDPFIWVNADPDGIGRIIGIHDPLEREEIRLLRIHWEPGGSKVEDVVQCSDMLRADHSGVNGQDKSRLRVSHYDLDCRISAQGHFTGRAVMSGRTMREPVQLLRLWLHPELTVRSVQDGSGANISYLRNEHADYPSRFLYIFLDRPYRPQEELTLTVEYDGDDMIVEHIGEFYMTAHSFWYPSPDERTGATFEMKFKTPKALQFVAAGEQVDRSVEGDSLVTRWSVDRPCKNVSFSLGATKKFDFKDESVGTVDVYYSEDLHADLAMRLVAQGNLVGKHMERQVGEDVLNALKLFQHDFGSRSTDRLAVSEIMEFHGESFPGFLHMGLPTWVATDAWGYQRLFRAHEVAHQWWGTDVGFETYHDQWLSEGLAEYSALLYVQAVEGNDVFLKKLREYRDEIFDADDLGPVALGYRNRTSDLADGFQVAVYKKGAFVAHMLRNLFLDLGTLGDERFFRFLRDYYQTYRGNNARTGDFRALAEKYAGMNLGWFFDQWIYGTALPTYRFAYEIVEKENGSFAAQCEVEVEDVPANFRMYVPVEVELDQKRKAYLRYLIEGPHHRFEVAGLPSRPKQLRLNPFESVLARVK